jgi:hypothetical protein
MAGTATAVSSGDAIPLLDDNGSGQYVKGRNNARDIRIGLLGALLQTDTDGFTPKSGVLNQQTQASGLFVAPQASPNQTVLIRKGRAVIQRSGQGVYLFISEQDQTVNMPAASAANFRTDLVCAMVGDLANFGTDAIHGPAFWVEQGALGGGVPATPAGMLKLAEVFRAANDNTISTEITDKRSFTSLANAIYPAVGADALVAGNTWGAIHDTGTAFERWDGTSAWVPLTEYGPAKLVGRVRRTTNLNYTNAAEAIGDNITFTPRAGRSYRIQLDAGSFSGNNTPSAALIKFRSVAGVGPITAGSTQRFAGVFNVPNGLSQGNSVGTVMDAGELGTAQVTVGWTTQGAAGNTSGAFIGTAAGHETTFSIWDVT